MPGGIMPDALDDVVARPHFGFTKLGQAVHVATVDHLAAETRYQRFNKSLALWITRNVGTMSCFWIFTVLSLLSLPATLHQMGIHVPIVPAYFLTFGFVLLITWVCQNYVQLVLLPALMVGQNLQNEANDARSAKTFEDVEEVRRLIAAVADHLGVPAPAEPE
jgi:hypothetical protein